MNVIFEEQRRALREKIQALNSSSAAAFAPLALEVFRFQATHNPVYRQFLSLLKRPAAQVQQIADIPFLPIELFKQHRIQTGNWSSELRFQSSGTTGQQASQHWVRDPAFYSQNARRTFEQQYGPLSQYAILALLPNYLERGNSSLVYMVQDFMQASKQETGFFLYDTDRLLEKLRQLQAQGQPTLLIGVSFALWDLAEQPEAFPRPFPQLLVMETGGMKGRRRELTRSELQTILKKGFHQENIHSEYGMTELLSQAYSKGDSWFKPAPCLRAYVRDSTDPLQLLPLGRSGGLNLVDLANLDSCSFIATSDIGRCRADGQFEVLGRLDASDLRGCNLMVQDIA